MRWVQDTVEGGLCLLHRQRARAFLRLVGVFLLLGLGDMHEGEARPGFPSGRFVSERVHTLNGPWEEERLVFSTPQRLDPHAWRLGLPKEPLRLSPAEPAPAFAVLADAGQVLRLTFSPMPDSEALPELSWVSDPALVAALRTALPGPRDARDSEALLERFALRAGRVDSTPVAGAQLVLPLWPLLRRHPFVPAAVEGGLLLTLPPQPGVLVGRWKVKPNPTWHPPGVQVFSAAPDRRATRWLGLEHALTEWLEQWPTSARVPSGLGPGAPPLPPQPAPLGWERLELLSTLLQGWKVDAQQAQRLLAVLARQTHLASAPAGYPFSSEVDLLEGQPDAQLLLSEDSARWWMLQPGEVKRLPVPGEGALELTLRGLGGADSAPELEPARVTGVIALQTARTEPQGPLSAPERLRPFGWRVSWMRGGSPSLLKKPDVPLTWARRLTLSLPSRARVLVLTNTGGPLLLKATLRTAIHRAPWVRRSRLDRAGFSRDPLPEQLLAPLLTSRTPQTPEALETLLQAQALLLLGDAPTAVETLRALEAQEQTQTRLPPTGSAFLQLLLVEALPGETQTQDALTQAWSLLHSLPTRHPGLEALARVLAVQRALRFGDLEALATALEQRLPSDPLEVWQEAAGLLQGLRRSEWTRDRLAGLAVPSAMRQPLNDTWRDALDGFGPGSTRWRSLVFQSTRARAGERGALRQETLLEPLEPGLDAGCREALAGRRGTLLNAIPPGLPVTLRVSSQRPGDAVQVPVQVTLALAGLELPGPIRLTLDGRSLPLESAFPLELLHLSLAPGEHTLAWEGPSEAIVVLERVAGLTLSTGAGAPLPPEAEPDSDCSGLFRLRSLYAVEGPIQARLPEPGVSGLVRLELRARGPQRVRGRPTPLRADVWVGDVRYPLELTPGPAQATRYSERGPDARAGDARVILLPIPPEVTWVRVEVPPEQEGGLAIRGYLRVHGPALGEPVLPSTSDVRALPPVSAAELQPEQKLEPQLDEALRQLTRLSQALRGAPTEQKGLLHLERGRGLLELQQRDLARLELHAALVQPLTAAQRQEAEQLLERLEQAAAWSQEVEGSDSGARAEETGGGGGLDPILALPERGDPIGLDLTEVRHALSRGKWEQALTLLVPLAALHPNAWRVAWLEAKTAEATGAYARAAGAWMRLARLSPAPALMWRKVAQTCLWALEQPHANPELAVVGYQAAWRMQTEAGSSTRSLTLSSPAEGLLVQPLVVETDRLSQTSRTQLLAEALSLQPRLGRYSRWRQLQHAEQSAGFEMLSLIHPDSDPGRTVRARVEDALLGVPWPLKEGALLDARDFAQAVLAFPKPGAVEVDLFCAFEGAVVNAQSDRALSDEPCRAFLLLDGEPMAKLELLPGVKTIQRVPVVAGEHTLEVGLSPARDAAARRPLQGDEHRLAVRLRLMPDALLARRSDPGNAASDAASAGASDAGQLLPFALRRRAFVATLQTPMDASLRGPGYLQLEARRLLSELPGTPARGTPSASVRVRLTRLDQPEKARGSQPIELPLLPDPTVRLEGRFEQRVAGLVQAGIELPEGVWQVQVLPTAPVVLNLRVREPLLPLPPPMRMQRPLEAPPGTLARLKLEPRGEQWEQLRALDPARIGAGPTLDARITLQGQNSSTQEDGLEGLEPTGALPASWILRARLRQSLAGASPGWPERVELTGMMLGQGLSTDGAGVLAWGERVQLLYPVLDGRLRVWVDQQALAARNAVAGGLRQNTRLEVAALRRLPFHIQLRPSGGATLESLHAWGALHTLDPYFQGPLDDGLLGPNAQLELYFRSDATWRPAREALLSSSLRAFVPPDLGTPPRMELRFLGAAFLHTPLKGGIELTGDWRTRITPPSTGSTARAILPEAVGGVVIPGGGTLTSSLGLGLRWLYGLEQDGRLELELAGRYAPLSQTGELRLTLGILGDGGRTFLDCLPGQEKFAPLWSTLLNGHAPLSEGY